MLSLTKDIVQDDGAGIIGTLNELATGEGPKKGRQKESVKGKGSADGRSCGEMVGW